MRRLVFASAISLLSALAQPGPVAAQDEKGEKGEKSEKGDKAAPATAAAPSAPVDLAKLRADYDRLRDELFRARARAELIQEGIYAARLGAKLRWYGAPDFLLRRAEIRLDGNSIWDSGEKPLVDELIKVSDRPIKPGIHALTVRLEVRPGKKTDKENQDLGYSSEQTFVLNVPDKKLTTIEISADDDGDLPEYEPEVEVEIDTESIK